MISDVGIIHKDSEFRKETHKKVKDSFQRSGNYQVDDICQLDIGNVSRDIKQSIGKDYKHGPISAKPHNLRIVSLSSPKPFIGSNCTSLGDSKPTQTEEVRANKNPFITPLPIDIYSSQYQTVKRKEHLSKSFTEIPQNEYNIVNSSTRRSEFSDPKFLNRLNDLKCRKSHISYKYTMGNTKTKYHMDDQTTSIDDLSAHPVSIAEYSDSSAIVSQAKLSYQDESTDCGVELDDNITVLKNSLNVPELVNSLNVPELVISLTEDTEQDSPYISDALSEMNKRTTISSSQTIDEGITLEKTTLRNSLSSDSAYSSDSRSTSVDSAPVGLLSDHFPIDGPPYGQPSACNDEIQSKQTKLLSPRSSSSSSSLSSSPGHSPGRQRSSSDKSLRVISDEGLQRQFSNSSSCSSFRSSLSFESEDDFLSTEGEMPMKETTGKRKAQNSWKKIRQMVIWSPFMQSFKKKYPWVQLAGHAGNFQPGEEGCILKKHCGRESECLWKLSQDPYLKPYAPEYHGIVEKENQKYTRMQDLLLDFDCPSVMDCKMGIRTYLEDELIKAKIQPKLRHDMYLKMKDVSPDEPTVEEHKQQAVTKPRYMQWREDVSSSSNLGFRIEGIKKGENDPSKDYKLTKTETQLKKAFKYFIDGNIAVLDKYIERLNAIRTAAEHSNFFMTHEVIGSSLLFVHDRTTTSGIWMIDFGKTSQLPNNNTLSHREKWVEGNREDGYLFGLDNLIQLFEEIHTEINLEQKDVQFDNNNQINTDGVGETTKTKTKSLRELSPNTSNDSFDTDTNDDKNLNKYRTKPPFIRQNAHSSKSCEVCGNSTEHDEEKTYDVTDNMTSFITNSPTEDKSTKSYIESSNKLLTNNNT